MLLQSRERLLSEKGRWADPIIRGNAQPRTKKDAIFRGPEMPEDRKVLGYWYQVLMIIIASSKNFPESLKEDEEGIQTKKNDEAVDRPRHVRHSKREAKGSKMNWWKSILAQMNNRDSRSSVKVCPLRKGHVNKAVKYSRGHTQKFQDWILLSHALPSDGIRSLPRKTGP